MPWRPATCRPHGARGTGQAEAAMIGADDTGGGGRQVPRRPTASFRSQEFAIASSGQINWMRFVQSSLWILLLVFRPWRAPAGAGGAWGALQKPLFQWSEQIEKKKTPKFLIGIIS